MRTFSCFTFQIGRAVPILSIILAADEQRALFLARRELFDSNSSGSTEIYESDKLVGTEWACKGACNFEQTGMCRLLLA